MYKKKNNYQITKEGNRFLQYLLDKKNGEEYTIAAYEEDIEGIMKKCNCSREAAIDNFIVVLKEYI